VILLEIVVRMPYDALSNIKGVLGGRKDYRVNGM